MDIYQTASESGFEWIGDVNPHYGGIAIRIDEWRSFAEFIEVTDLESATGADSLVLIQSGTIPLGMAWRKQAKSGMDCIGMAARDLLQYPRESRAIQIAYAMHAYGCYDSDFQTIVCLNSDANRESWDSWAPDIALHGESEFADYLAQMLAGANSATGFMEWEDSQILCPQVNSQYGAPMGRRGAHGGDDPHCSMLIVKIPLDSGGYDMGGAYWGTPSTLWGIYGRDEFEGESDLIRDYCRADSIDAAMAHWRERFPNARLSTNV